jgi:hypothetical protein
MNTQNSVCLIVFFLLLAACTPLDTATRPTTLPTPTTPASRISAYTFADADHGWLAIDQKLWHTTDGGTTWQPQFDLPEPAEQIVFTALQQAVLPHRVILACVAAHATDGDAAHPERPRLPGLVCHS